MFQAMRRIVSCLVNEYVGEGAFERAIRHSFLGMIQFVQFLLWHCCTNLQNSVFILMFLQLVFSFFFFFNLYI